MQIVIKGQKQLLMGLSGLKIHHWILSPVAYLEISSIRH